MQCGWHAWRHGTACEAVWCATRGYGYTVRHAKWYGVRCGAACGVVWFAARYARYGTVCDTIRHTMAYRSRDEDEARVNGADGDRPGVTTEGRHRPNDRYGAACTAVVRYAQNVACMTRDAVYTSSTAVVILIGSPRCLKRLH